MCKKTKRQLFLFAVVVFSIVLIVLSVNSKTKNFSIPYIFNVVFLLVLLWVFIYSIKWGTSTTGLKEVFNEVADKIGLSLSKPSGMKKLLIPLTCFLVLEGDYKNYKFSIVPTLSLIGPFGSQMNMISWGHVDLNVEVSLINIDQNNNYLKKDGSNLFIETPDELKAMPYKFKDDRILVVGDKLVLKILYKCPKTKEDLIKIIDSLCEIGNIISSH